MTIDERLDRLTERHEALTGHVEILHADMAQMSADIRLLTADLAQLKERVDELTESTMRQRRTMDDLMLGFSTLAELVRSHDRRIERLESR